MKVAVCQTSPVLCDVKSNMEEVISHIQQCREKGAELVVFPELALTGYFVGQRYHEVSLRLDSKEIRQIASATKGVAAVIGFIEESSSMNFYNSALICVDGKTLFAYRKLNLPNYGVFEERKIFSAGKHVPVFKLHDFNVATFICNDLWHPSLPYLGVTQKADILITLFNSSQGSMGDEFSNIESWSIINRFYSRIFGVYNICANRVGEESFEQREAISREKARLVGNEKNSNPTCNTISYRFWGGSEILNPFGMNIAKAKLHEPDLIFGKMERDLLRRKRIRLPYLRNDDPYFTHRELSRILYE